MPANAVSIRHDDESQQAERIQKIAAEVAGILTPNEEILYIAGQNITALSTAPDGVAATNNRILLYRPSILGRAAFDEFQWQDVKEVRMRQGMLSSELGVETTDGRSANVGNLDKDQTKRLYGICHQMEQEWREKRRVREMEEARARSGGVYVGTPAEAAPAAAPEDPVQRLAKAKAMLDQGLISEAEYDTLKARLLNQL